MCHLIRVIEKTTFCGKCVFIKFVVIDRSHEPYQKDSLLHYNVYGIYYHLLFGITQCNNLLV